MKRLAHAPRLSEIKIPPHNLEAEMALIGSVMLRNEALFDVSDIVSSPVFYSDRHRCIWKTFLAMSSKGSPIDLVSVASCLTEANDLERSGGASYLTQTVQSVPTAANARHYAEIIHKKYIMRELIRASENIASIGYDEMHEIEHAMDIAQKSIFDISTQGGSFRASALKELLPAALERLDKMGDQPDGLRGVPTGFRELDNKLSGLQKSDLIILAARPSVGKTSLALDIARNAAVKHKVPVAIFSLEMSSQQLVDRMVAAEARIDAWKLRTNRITDEADFESIRDAVSVLSDAPLFIDDQPGANIMRIRSTARKLRAEKNLGLIIVDYLQLITPIQSKSSDNVVQQITEISRGLKQLAREMDVPVLALSQLSRAVEQRGGKPRLSDLRDSGSIEQDADVVFFIHRDDKNKEESSRSNVAEILIEKHRNGPTGRLELYFDDKKSSFISIDKNFGQNLSGGNQDF